MLRVEYISTKDIDKVSKLHSKPKFFNWDLKIVDDEYRFYPPITIEENDYFDDFDFEQDDEYDSFFDEILDKTKVMVGETWESTTNFFNEIDENEIIKGIKKSGSIAKIDKYYQVPKCKSYCKFVNKDKHMGLDSDSYKLYRVRPNKDIEAKIILYKNQMVLQNIKDFIKNSIDAVEEVVEETKEEVKNIFDTIESLEFDEEII